MLGCHATMKLWEPTLETQFCYRHLPNSGALFSQLFSAFKTCLPISGPFSPPQIAVCASWAQSPGPSGQEVLQLLTNVFYICGIYFEFATSFQHPYFKHLPSFATQQPRKQQVLPNFELQHLKRNKKRAARGDKFMRNKMKG